MRWSEPTMSSRTLRSLPRSWARWRSDQIAGSSISAPTSARRLRFVSKSKIPPQLGRATREGLNVRSDGVDALGFHLGLTKNRTGEYTAGGRRDSVRRPPVLDGELNAARPVVLVDAEPVDRMQPRRQR